MAGEDEVDRMMAELGLNQEKPRPGGLERGATMRGEEHLVDALMADLGIDTKTPVSAPPTKVSSGPGRGRGLSSGPGAGRGRGALPPGGRGTPLATHTPDGRAIVHTGPPCAVCSEMVIGQCINALGNSYHPECFVCTACNQPFPGGSFIEHEGKPYCETDYNDLFAPRCVVCHQSIVDKCVNAAGHQYHPNCFNCTGCGLSLIGKAFREDEGEVFCTSCKQARQQRIAPNAELCGKCKRPIIGEWITLNGQKLHPEHFRCEQCGVELKGGNCREFEGKYYCNECYHGLQKSTCASCHKPILGRSITALGRLWHPEHFVCFVCHDPFTGSSFFEHDGKPYCQTHYAQQFGEPCAKCGRAVVTEALHFFDKVYHQEHFVCTACEQPMKKGKIQEWEGKPMCIPCYKKLPDEVRKRVEKKREAEKKLQKQKEKEDKKAAKK